MPPGSATMLVRRTSLRWLCVAASCRHGRRGGPYPGAGNPPPGSHALVGRACGWVASPHRAGPPEKRSEAHPVTRARLTEAEREQNRATERDLAERAVEELRTSAGWQCWLGVRRHFYCYTAVILSDACCLRVGVG
jgi:hypothetical protein